MIPSGTTPASCCTRRAALHAGGARSHWNGYKVDIAPTTCVTRFIKRQYDYIGKRGDGAAHVPVLGGQRLRQRGQPLGHHVQVGAAQAGRAAPAKGIWSIGATRTGAPGRGAWIIWPLPM